MSLALVAMLAVATVCSAAEPAYAPGRGSIGGGIGIASFRFDRMFGNAWFGDFSAGALPRPAFDLRFRYACNPWLRLQVSPGMSWTGYKGDEPAPFPDPRFGDSLKTETISIMVPISFQAQYVMKRGWWLYHLGAGPGVYRVWIENRRKVLKDPVTLINHRGLYPGFSGELGAELFLKSLPSTSVELQIGSDVAFTTKLDQFPSGYNTNVMMLSARLGANYQFSPGVPRKKETPPPTGP